MISGALEAGAAILIAIIGAGYVIGQVHNSNKRNAEDIETIKEMIHDYQQSVHELLSKSMSDMMQMLDVQREHTRENLGREIAHIKDLISMSNNETREDIKRLEMAQKESNKIKERLAIAENSLKSLHHRLDIDPPVILRENSD